MITTYRHHHPGLLPVALTLSAGLHLAMLSVHHEPPVTAGSRSGQHGLLLELVDVRPADDTANPHVNQITEQQILPASNIVPQLIGSEPVPHSVTTMYSDKPSQPAHHAMVASNPAVGPQTAYSAAELSTKLHTQIHQAMDPYFNYPLLARRRGWQGTVKIGLRIAADGQISQLHIVEASRYPVLDRAALDSLGSVKTVPAAIAWLGGRHSDIVLPVEYRLTDS